MKKYIRNKNQFLAFFVVQIFAFTLPMAVRSFLNQEMLPKCDMKALDSPTKGRFQQHLSLTFEHKLNEKLFFQKSREKM